MWLKILRYGTIANFLLFGAISIWLRGDAFQGYSANGHYFFAFNGHGPIHEVSRGLFLYSEIHAAITFVAMLIAFSVGMALHGETKEE